MRLNVTRSERQTNQSTSFHVRCQILLAPPEQDLLQRYGAPDIAVLFKHAEQAGELFVGGHEWRFTNVRDAIALEARVREAFDQTHAYWQLAQSWRGTEASYTT